MEELHRKMMELVKEYMAPDTAEQVLATLAVGVGQALALQDQRTMTPDRGLAIIEENIVLGNEMMVDALRNMTAGRG